jgi:hypothetical protein
VLRFDRVPPKVEKILNSGMSNHDSLCLKENISGLDTPQADRFPSDDNAAFSKEILDIPVTEIESVIEPDCVRDNIWRKSVSFVGFLGLIRLKSAS